MCNNAKSESLTVNCGVPQGSVLGPSLFCLTFNPIANSFVDSKPSLYADDIETHCSHSNLDLAQSMINQDLQRVDQWLADNKMIPNVKKTKSMLIGSRQALKRRIRLKSIWIMRSLMKSAHSITLVFVLVTHFPGNIM